MKKKKRILIIILICLGGMTLGLLLLINHPQEQTALKENTKEENTKEEIPLAETQTVNGIQFTNINCTFDGDYYLIDYTMTNITEEEIHLTEYELIIKDKEENILANISPVIELTLAPKESYNTGNRINIDLSNAYSIEIQIN